MIFHKNAQSDSSLKRPIFFIGMPRSGTTIIFEAFSRHPDLGWISGYCRMHPRRPWVNVLRRIFDNRLLKLHSKKKQYGRNRLINFYLPIPDEAYEFWDMYAGVPFSSNALPGISCSEARRDALRNAVSEVLGWQGKTRLAAKFTGPPRISFLSSIFPDAIFVHVVRDGRAVVQSLLEVKFWIENSGFEKPFWEDLLTQSLLDEWERHDRDSGVLAALQWKRVVELAKLESEALEAGQYNEVNYEEFVRAPHDVLSQLFDMCGLDDSSSSHDILNAGAELRNMNDKYHAVFKSEYISLLSRSMQPILKEHGYV